MDKTLIIGGGFSALIAKLLLAKQPAQIISAMTHPTALANTSNTTALVRRPALEINKLFCAQRAPSLGALQSQLTKGLLHDRLSHGGNSVIWGGFCNAAQLNPPAKEMLSAHGIDLVPLSFSQTGSASNVAGLSQLTQKDGRILNAAKLLGPSITDAYATQLSVSNSGTLQVSLWGQAQPLECQRIILAVGTVQLIDLLYRSGIIVDGDILTLTEFKHRLRLKPTLNAKPLSQQDCVIRYHPMRAIYHALGVQKMPKWLIRFPLPFYVDQTFYSQAQELQLHIAQGVLQALPLSQNRQADFGGSIHYCNLRINGMNVNQLLARFHPQLIALGMPALTQMHPGPISNDIINDAALKIASL